MPLLLLWIPGVAAGPPAPEDRHGTSPVTAAARRLQHPEEILETAEWLTSLDDDEIALIISSLFI